MASNSVRRPGEVSADDRSLIDRVLAAGRPDESHADSHDFLVLDSESEGEEKGQVQQKKSKKKSKKKRKQSKAAKRAEKEKASMADQASYSQAGAQAPGRRRTVTDNMIDPSRASPRGDDNRSVNSNNSGGVQQSSRAAPRRHRFSDQHLTPKQYATEEGQQIFFKQQRTTMTELEREMLLYRNAHDAAQNLFRFRYYFLVSVCLLLTFSVTTLAGWMTTTTGPGCQEFKYVVTTLSAMNAVSVALIAFLKYQSKMDAHGNAATQFGELYESFHFGKFANQFTYMELDELLKKLDGTKKSFMDIARACPYALPNKIQNRLGKNLKDIEDKRHGIFRKLSQGRNPATVKPADED